MAKQNYELILSDATERSLTNDEAELLRKLIERDALTNLYNRRKFMTDLDRAVRRANNGHPDLALLMLDIDHFKKVNDNYGHNVGDIVLERVSEVLLDKVRTLDKGPYNLLEYANGRAYRHGGEEKAVILPEISDLERALVIGDRLRTEIEGLEIQELEGNNVTVSVGIAHYSDVRNIKGFVNANELYKAADFALYHAKEIGRNRVVGYNEPLVVRS